MGDFKILVNYRYNFEMYTNLEKVVMYIRIINIGWN